MDPRRKSAQFHTLDEDTGKVLGVHLTVHERADTAFKCASVRVLGEEEARGQTVARVSFEGDLNDGVFLGLLTGYSGSGDRFAERLALSNWEAVITNKFNPPNLGPLAIALITEDGVIVSDVVGSLGLPYGRHVSYEISFRWRGSVAGGSEDMDLMDVFQELRGTVDLLGEVLENKRKRGA